MTRRRFARFMIFRFFVFSVNLGRSASAVFPSGEADGFRWWEHRFDEATNTLGDGASFDAAPFDEAANTLRRMSRKQNFPC